MSSALLQPTLIAMDVQGAMGRCESSPNDVRFKRTFPYELLPRPAATRRDRDREDASLVRSESESMPGGRLRSVEEVGGSSGLV